MTAHQPFHVMLKACGSQCNLACTYCYYRSKETLYPGSSLRMTTAVLERFTEQYLSAQSGPEVTFSWQGGEPSLMGIAFYERAVAAQQKFRKPGTTILNTFQTNGTLIDKAWAEFFYAHQFLVGVSLDGTQPMHDAYRVDKNGAPTHARVLGGIAALQAAGVDYNILCCVHKANATQPIELYRYLRDEIGARFIQFIPIIERINHSGFQEGFQVSRRSVSGADYGSFLIQVFDEWIGGDVGKVFVQIFDAALAAWCGSRAGICIFEKTCGTALALEHNGDVYSCDHYVEPGSLLGNIQHEDLATLVHGEQQVRFGQAKLATLPQFCLDCAVRFVCHGECPKNRIRKTPSGEPGLNYLCAGYKAFFTHIDRPMRAMRQMIAPRA